MIVSFFYLKVKEIINNSELNCSCSHLTSFAGSYLVPPNKINMEKVYNELQSLKESGKFLVLAIVLMYFLIYLVAIVLARRADNNDKAKVRSMVEFNNIYILCIYLIFILRNTPSVTKYRIPKSPLKLSSALREQSTSISF